MRYSAGAIVSLITMTTQMPMMFAIHDHVGSSGGRSDDVSEPAEYKFTDRSASYFCLSIRTIV